MKFKTIRSKLIVFLLLATTIPISTTMLFSYFYTNESLKQRVAVENMNLLFQGANNLSALLDNLNRASSNIYTIQSLIQGGYNDMFSESRVYDALRYMTTVVPDVYQVYLYEKKNNKATLVTLNTPSRNLNIDVYPIMDTNEQILPTHLSHTYGLTSLTTNKYTARHVFTLQNKIEKIPSTEVIGHLAIDVDIKAIANIVHNLYDSGDEKFYIIDHNNQLIYSEDATQYEQPFASNWYDEGVLANEQLQDYFEAEHSLFVYQKIKNNLTDWTLVKEIPIASLTKETKKAAAINILLLTISLIIIIIATIIISIRITMPIRQLSRYMSLIQTGQLDVAIPSVKHQDEISNIINRFREMMNTINNLVLREYKLELSSKNNQLKAMQAQINPHFLNNTLQIIGTLALEQNNDRIYKLLSSLAKMMQYSMHNNKVVTLNDELNHVKAYIELQKERYENLFSVQYNIDETLLSLPVPKLILQPIVENYFKHGFERNNDNQQLMIQVNVLHANTICIKISNNGLPIAPEKLHELNQKLEHTAINLLNHTDHDSNEDTTHPSIGLNNVLTRLKLLYDNKAILEIGNNADNKVTSVMITFPAQVTLERE